VQSRKIVRHGHIDVSRSAKIYR